MAHKTLINGTAYEIDGGKAMVDGTVYEIDHGTTLVDGTAYEVGFAPAEATVTITGSGLFVGNVAAYVIIEGVQYTESASVVVPTGTVIPCTVIANSGYAYVYLNGTVVASVNANSYENFTTYNYTLKGNVTIELSVGKGSGGVRITEE